MRDHFKADMDGFLLSIDYWKMNWIILIDNSGSMGHHALDPNNLAIDAKNAIGTMLEEIKKISEEQEILNYIRIIAFNELISYAVGNRSHGEYITEAENSWRSFELIPNGGTNVADAIYEAGGSILADRPYRYLDGGSWLPNVMILMTDGMVNLADRVGNAVNYIKSIRNGQTIRVSIGLRHEYSIELDPFASRGSIEHLDGRIDEDRPFSFFVEQSENLTNVCKYLSWGLAEIAKDNESPLLEPMDAWDEEDDDWCWE